MCDRLYSLSPRRRCFSSSLAFITHGTSSRIRSLSREGSDKMSTHPLSQRSNMRIGILGSGLMGGKLGTLFARAGHEVVFSYARSKEKLNRLAREAEGNARAGTPGEAAEEADAVLLAVHWSRMDDVLNRAGGLSGKVIVTCSLPM